ncbi:hypothetical protein L1887_59219 [Cichorium endivia]|nr:hypothetical protein L1887_59219 [Cichorium endivia]
MPSYYGHSSISDQDITDLESQAALLASTSSHPHDQPTDSAANGDGDETMADADGAQNGASSSNGNGAAATEEASDTRLKQARAKSASKVLRFSVDREKKRRRYVGDNDLNLYRRDMEISSIFDDDGIVADHPAFAQLCSFGLDQLSCDASEHPLLLTEPAWNTRESREKLTELAFETLGSPRLLSRQPKRAQLVCSRQAVEPGHRHWLHECIHHPHRRWLHPAQGHPQAQQRWRCHQPCAALQPAPLARRRLRRRHAAAQFRSGRMYEFPDGYNDAFGIERLKAPELLFSPSLWNGVSSTESLGAVLHPSSTPSSGDGTTGTEGAAVAGGGKASVGLADMLAHLGSHRPSELRTGRQGSQPEGQDPLARQLDRTKTLVVARRQHPSQPGHLPPALDLQAGVRRTRTRHRPCSLQVVPASPPSVTSPAPWAPRVYLISCFQSKKSSSGHIGFLGTHFFWGISIDFVRKSKRVAGLRLGLPDGEAAVGTDDRAGHVGSLVGKQQHGGLALLVGLREPAEGDAGGLEVADLGVHARGLLRVAEARLENVDADAVLRPLGGEALAQVGDGTLGRVVEDLGERIIEALLVVDLGRHGRGDDDGALLEARLDPELRGGLGRVEDAEDVGVVDVAEVLRGELHGGLDHRDTGVGKQTRDLAEVVLRLLHGLLDQLGVADVALVRLDLGAVLLGHLLGRLLRLGMRAVEDGHVGARSSHGFAHGETCRDERVQQDANDVGQHVVDAVSASALAKCNDEGHRIKKLTDTTVAAGDDDGLSLEVDDERHFGRKEGRLLDLGLRCDRARARGFQFEQECWVGLARTSAAVSKAWEQLDAQTRIGRGASTGVVWSEPGRPAPHADRQRCEDMRGHSSARASELA